MSDLVIWQEIPQDWQKIRLKFVARFAYGDSLPSGQREEGEVPVYGSNGIVGYHDIANALSPAVIVGRKGSFGKVTYSEFPSFAIDTTYFIDSRYSKQSLRWLYYALQTLELDKLSQDTGVPGLSRENAYEYYLGLPPDDVQKAIASFLDRKTAAIDTLIAKKQRLIQLLEEKRTGLINQAVTKGLNPYAPMKDSSISWICEIPMHWKVLRLKLIAEVRSGVAKRRDLKDKNIIELPYLRVANVQDGYLDLSDIANIAIEVSEERKFLLRKGDILMNEGGDDDKLGRGAVWEGQIEPCIHQNHVFAVRPFKGINSYWINLTTQASYLKHFFLTRAKRTTNLASISSSSLKESPILFPPTQEQEEIIAKLQKDLEQNQKIYTTIVLQIEKLQEYRQSLITAAVTGKINVNRFAKIKN